MEKKMVSFSDLIEMKAPQNSATFPSFQPHFPRRHAGKPKEKAGGPLLTQISGALLLTQSQRCVMGNLV